MNSSIDANELDDRIAIARANLQQLTEQAAAISGSAAEERIAERIADQQAALDALVKERERRD